MHKDISTYNTTYQHIVRMKQQLVLHFQCPVDGHDFLQNCGQFVYRL